MNLKNLKVEELTSIEQQSTEGGWLGLLLAIAEIAWEATHDPKDMQAGYNAVHGSYHGSK
ncbi:hypothetical protein HHL23_00755 [Chryseobacterium sp. RP-3-3]|uniref:Uncharacterized protein n=1 Tax=Chryseobacterium antibioticum TaxID=2728847 RepID=A0A7Y0AJ86_9FLAO|nr:hypothetical protein [Chryseobacterium antibioticum]NML68335.1 hypothetical protein [Chryseobacterium antibioticum]